MRTLAAAAVLLLTACASVRNPNHFTVEVATHWQPQEAWKIREHLADRGYDAYIDETMETLRSARPLSILVTNDRGVTYPTPTRYHVRVGPFSNVSDAENARSALRTAGFRAYVSRR